jgi:hypothetical protein
MADTSVRRGLARLMLRCPEVRRQLEARYDADADLRALCAVYEDAHEALSERQLATARIAAEISDYAHVIGDLETEIRQRVLEPAVS